MGGCLCCHCLQHPEPVTGTGKWSHGVICGACDHGVLPFCVNNHFLMWCTEGQIWSAYDVHNFFGCSGFLYGCLSSNPGYPCLIRRYVAEAHGIPYSIWTDYSACICPTLAWVQAANEAITRGKIGTCPLLKSRSGAPRPVSVEDDC